MCNFLLSADGPEVTSIRKYVHKHELEGKVILCGIRRDIPQILGSIDIFLFPSLWGKALVLH